jgi:carboxymethylenebutenolidase
MTDRLPETENWVKSTQIDRRHALIGGVAIAGYALAAQPVEAAIQTAADGLDAGMISFPASGGLTMNAYRARPKGKGNLPVIIVVQEIFGVHEWIRDICRRLAKAGYYAIAPDYYQRQGDATKVADIGTLFTTIVAKVPDAQVMADTDAALAFAARDGGSGTRFGITGFCWGGRITWLYAAHNPRLKAGVAWYGRLAGSGNPLTPKQPIELIPAMRAPVLGLYGALDKGIPVADVDKMNAALKQAHKPSALIAYPQADHGFLADYRPSYNEAAAKDGWAKALAYFKKYV